MVCIRLRRVGVRNPFCIPSEAARDVEVDYLCHSYLDAKSVRMSKVMLTLVFSMLHRVTVQLGSIGTRFWDRYPFELNELALG